MLTVILTMNIQFYFFDKNIFHNLQTILFFTKEKLNEGKLVLILSI